MAMNVFENQGTVFSFTVHCTCELPVEGSDESKKSESKMKSRSTYSPRSAKEGGRDVLYICKVLGNKIKSCLMQLSVKSF